MIIDIDIADQNWGDVEAVARQAAGAALEHIAGSDNVEIGIKLSGNDEVQRLNRDYRGKDKPTNVLSFETETPNLPWQSALPRPFGDIILAYDVVRHEAAEQGKTLENHLSHLIVHGVLHLSGYGHQTADAASEMEALEVEILARLGISDPYLV